MFVLVTGKPRSGKTYYAVDFILTNETKYHEILININGVTAGDNIKLLNFKSLMSVVSECKDIYDNQIETLGSEATSNIDKPIVEFLLSIDFIFMDSDGVIKPKLIILDEAQNQMPSKVGGKIAQPDDIISWWISYHGHLYMDVILLSQNYHKINPSYIYDIEYFLDAVPSSRTLLGNFSQSFTYNHYISTPYNGRSFAGKKRINKDKKVFSFYESGDKVRTKSVILPWVIAAIIALVVVIAIVYFYTNSLTSRNLDDNITLEKDKVKQQSNKKRVTNDKLNRHNKYNNYVNSFELDSFSYFPLFCTKNTCVNISKNIEIKREDLKDLLKYTDSKQMNVKKLNKKLTKVYVLVSPFFLGLFTIGAKNEKDNNIGDISMF